MRTGRFWLGFGLAASFALGPSLGLAQNAPADIETLKKTAPKVFIDCSSCDLEYIKTEVTFVNYVRDRKEAQVHILITTQSTGSGGKEYTLTFMGQNEFRGTDDVLRYFSNKTDTEDEIRLGLVKILKVGLAGYAARTPIASRLSVSYENPKTPGPVKDKWNSWVFSLSGDGYFNGEKSVSYRSVEFNASANRITPGVKLRLGLSADFAKNEFDYYGEKFESVQESYEFRGLYVASLGEHWSAGFSLDLESSTYENIRFAAIPAPAIEYNLFPYSQSSRRQLRFLYKIGVRSVRYREETIYSRTAETRFTESLSATLDIKEKWGSISTSLSGSHYFHDLSKYNLSLFGMVSLNLVKGLSAYVLGGGGMIHDQLGLVKGAASIEEIILRRRELETSYNYFMAVGISYTFGSIYTNVVNPRFGSIGGSGVHIEMD